jgi:hypothetical protein
VSGRSRGPFLSGGPSPGDSGGSSRGTVVSGGGVSRGTVVPVTISKAAVEIRDCFIGLWREEPSLSGPEENCKPLNREQRETDAKIYFE